VLPFDFKQELHYFLESVAMDEDMAAAFFAPCSRYSFTRLGLQFFKVKETEQNYVNTQKQLPFPFLRDEILTKHDVLHSIPMWANQTSHPVFDALKKSGLVYVFKVKNETDPSLWAYFEVPEECTLHRLYQETAVRFGLIRNDEYSFYHDETENPFTEYVSPKRLKRAKKTADIPLNSLDFDHKKRLLMTAYNQGEVMSSSVHGMAG
jgi:hypothetical protein